MRSAQLAQRLAAAVHQVLRPAGQIVDRHLGHVDAKVMIEGGEDVAKLHRPLGHLAAQTISYADDLAGLHPATGQQGAGDARPMIATGILVDRRGAAELAPDYDGYILVQTALVQILD